MRGSTARSTTTIRPKPVAYDVDKDVASTSRNSQDEFPGVEVVPAAVRDYPNGNDGLRTSSGWVGQITADDDRRPRNGSKDYGPNDLVGQAGLESQYERFLRGHKGRQKYLVNSDQEIAPPARRGSPPSPATTSCCRSTSTSSGSPRRRSLDGIEHTRGRSSTSQIRPAT